MVSDRPPIWERNEATNGPATVPRPGASPLPRANPPSTSGQSAAAWGAGAPNSEYAAATAAVPSPAAIRRDCLTSVIFLTVIPIQNVLHLQRSSRYSRPGAARTSLPRKRQPLRNQQACRLLPAGSLVGFGYFLKASFTFSPASLRLDFAWSTRTSF